MSLSIHFLDRPPILNVLSHIETARGYISLLFESNTLEFVQKVFSPNLGCKPLNAPSRASAITLRASPTLWRRALCTEAKLRHDNLRNRTFFLGLWFMAMGIDRHTRVPATRGMQRFTYIVPTFPCTKTADSSAPTDARLYSCHIQPCPPVAGAETRSHHRGCGLEGFLRSYIYRSCSPPHPLCKPSHQLEGTGHADRAARSLGPSFKKFWTRK